MTPGDLRATLDCLGLSQTGLGERTGYPRQNVQRWLSGSRPMPPWLPGWLAMFEHLTPEQRLEIWP